MDVKIRAVGIAELRKALKQVSADLPGDLKNGFARLANKVAEAIRPKVPGTGRAASSIKGRGTAKGGAIVFGGSKAPHFPWLDFGGSVGRGHVPGRAWSGAIKREWRGIPKGEGRYVYPTIREKREDIIKEADDVLASIAARAGFETREA